MEFGEKVFDIWRGTGTKALKKYLFKHKKYKKWSKFNYFDIFEKTGIIHGT